MFTSRTRRRVLATALVATTSVSMVACSSSSEGDDQTVKVATSPGPYSELFKEGVGPVLEGEGYKLEYVEFTDLQQADVAVSEGSADLNVDQHIAYMENFNKETNSNLVNLTDIPTVPAGLYSSTHKSLDEVADGQTVGVPQDASNQSRAFLMLEQAGWLKLKEDANKSTLTNNDVAENPHNLQIKPMDSATIPRSLDDLDWGVIPGSISYSSGVDTNLQLFQETLRPELILQAVTTEDKKDSEWAKAVVEAYKSDEFHSFLDKENENGYWFVPDSIK